MGILKRLIQVIQWLASLLFTLGIFTWIIILIYKGYTDYKALTIMILPYPLIILIRWILFNEWIFLPWQKTKKNKVT